MNIPPLSLYFLCIGVDPNFIAYLLAAAEHLNLSLDTCKTLQDAQRKIQSSSYDMFIIDLELSPTYVLDLVEEIRKKEGKNCTIAVISSNFRDEERFIKLKEKEVIDYILQKPIYPQQVDDLLTDLSQRHSTASTLPSTNKLLELKRNYEKTIYDKIDLLTKLIRAAQENPDMTHLKELKDAVHKIGGSAGSYGYAPASVLCKDLDSQITDKLSVGITGDRKWLFSLDEFLHKIKYCFQTSSLKEPHSILAHSSIPRPSLFIIHHDVKFLELLEHVKEQFPLDLTVESDPKKAIEKLKSADFNPSAVLISQTFPNSPLTAFDVIESQHPKIKHKPVVFGLILKDDNIDIRIEAMQKGIHYIFREPVSAYVLLKAMKDALEIDTLNNFKVLILDDDPDFCNFVTLMLSEIGITVRCIHDSTELFSTLEDFRPQILLLDLVLPKYDGLNLLKTIRQDISYNNLIIVIVTSSEETAIRLNAYSAKADDILYKPLDKSILQKRILNLAERYASLGELPNAQDYTGLVHLKSLMAELHRHLTSPQNINQFLVLFEVDHFSDWIMQKGNTAAKDLLISISNQLQWETDHAMQCFSYNSSKFAIIFKDLDVQSIEKKMYTLLDTLVKSEIKQNVNFNCCIVPISKNFENAQQILQAAEQGLQEASEKEPTPVKVIVLLPKGSAIPNKEIVLIDPDQELLRILKTAFESHDIVVKTYVEGGDALKDLLACNENQLPVLIIAERKLPDMDGLEILIKLKTRFRTIVPFYILTIFSSDKDVSQGLSQGALEYIVKPFNISLLIQKALKTIS